MSSASTAARSPPPTINNLGAGQRARVMRSSRKLGAVLGTTPFLLESCGSSVPAVLCPTSSKHDDARMFPVSSHIKRHHRKCSVLEEVSASSDISPLVLLSRDSASSNESLLTMSESSTEELPAPLMLAAMSQPSSGNAPRPLVLCLNSVPLSPSDPRVQGFPLTPLSPNMDVPSSPDTPVELSRAEARRRKMARVVRTLGENVPQELVFQPSDMDWPENPPMPTARLLDARLISRTRSTGKSHRRRSSSVGSNSQWQRLLELPAPVFSSSPQAPEDQHWVGAWNRRNIAQVQRELRALRGH
ncbi:hypothetical protein B0F90DRAFT_1817547 [Multifurca ochricompacta]|uniref:Uncharacterized protein n=1 Tax=Multifurca ochricompacta TaxID=376703 RepID=A0AAD4M338_9AGAM|nr:hypothetical protein B0F90DRAFT_1817547 [Multifurca ochricompacta]